MDELMAIDFGESITLSHSETVEEDAVSSSSMNKSGKNSQGSTLQRFKNPEVSKMLQSIIKRYKKSQKTEVENLDLKKQLDDQKEQLKEANNKILNLKFIAEQAAEDFKVKLKDERTKNLDDYESLANKFIDHSKILDQHNLLNSTTKKFTTKLSKQLNQFSKSSKKKKQLKSIINETPNPIAENQNYEVNIQISYLQNDCNMTNSKEDNNNLNQKKITVDKGTQYISSTTTRSCSTSAFIKTRSLGTSFPESSEGLNMTVDSILENTSFNIPKAISPIKDAGMLYKRHKSTQTEITNNYLSYSYEEYDEKIPQPPYCKKLLQNPPRFHPLVISPSDNCDKPQQNNLKIPDVEHNDLFTNLPDKNCENRDSNEYEDDDNVYNETTNAVENIEKDKKNMDSLDFQFKKPNQKKKFKNNNTTAVDVVLKMLDDQTFNDCTGFKDCEEDEIDDTQQENHDKQLEINKTKEDFFKNSKNENSLYILECSNEGNVNIIFKLACAKNLYSIFSQIFDTQQFNLDVINKHLFENKGLNACIKKYLDSFLKKSNEKNTENQNDQHQQIKTCISYNSNNWSNFNEKFTNDYDSLIRNNTKEIVNDVKCKITRIFEIDKEPASPEAQQLKPESALIKKRNHCDKTIQGNMGEVMDDEDLKLTEHRRKKRKSHEIDFDDNEHIQNNRKDVTDNEKFKIPNKPFRTYASNRNCDIPIQRNKAEIMDDKKFEIPQIHEIDKEPAESEVKQLEPESVLLKKRSLYETPIQNNVKEIMDDEKFKSASPEAQKLKPESTLVKKHNHCDKPIQNNMGEVIDNEDLKLAKYHRKKRKSYVIDSDEDKQEQINWEKTRNSEKYKLRYDRLCRASNKLDKTMQNNRKEGVDHGKFENEIKEKRAQKFSKSTKKFFQKEYELYRLMRNKLNYNGNNQMDRVSEIVEVSELDEIPLQQSAKIKVMPASPTRTLKKYNNVNQLN